MRKGGRGHDRRAPPALRWAGLGGLALLAGPANAAQPAGAPAVPAASVFTSHDYQLAARVPPGLFSCLFPPDWVGAYHGPEFYLVRPSACDPNIGIALAWERVPRIAVDYEHNVAETVPDRGDLRVPATDAELMARPCRGRTRIHARLFGRRVPGCVRRSGRSVDVVIGAVYSQSPTPQPGALPGTLVMLRLSTTAARVRRDVWTLRRLAASLHVCADTSRTSPPDLPARGPPCPPY